MNLFPKNYNKDELTVELKEKNKYENSIEKQKILRKKLNSRIKILQIKSDRIEKPANLTYQQYILIFDEIVRRMIYRQVHHQQICLPKQKLIDAVIYYENKINAGKNSQGKLERCDLSFDFVSSNNVDEELINRFIKIIHFHGLTLKSIVIDNNYFSDSVLEKFFSELMLEEIPVLQSISIWQFPNLSEVCINIILK